MADVLKKVPVREQEPKVRATNFEEVCYGYNKEEAMEEATRCLNCKNARCIQGCPVSINIPAFIAEIKEGNIEEAYKVIGQSNNVDRFAQYLHKLTKYTQFIVITHRRGTMTAADRLYGITMQEKGVSTLVSVSLLENELDK